MESNAVVTTEHAPFREVLADLRAERGMTVEDVGLEVRARVRARGESAGRRGASFSSYQKHAAGTGSGSPSMFLMEMVAEVFDIDPWRFTEYRLAYYRRLLDERPPPEGVGPRAAVLALAAIDPLLAPARAGEDPAQLLEDEFERADLLGTAEEDRAGEGPADERRAAGEAAG